MPVDAPLDALPMVRQGSAASRPIHSMQHDADVVERHVERARQADTLGHADLVRAVLATAGRKVAQ